MLLWKLHLALSQTWTWMIQRLSLLPLPEESMLMWQPRLALSQTWMTKLLYVLPLSEGRGPLDSAHWLRLTVQSQTQMTQSGSLG